MSAMTLGRRDISRDGDSYYIIAEIGVNHENNLDTALELISSAKENGADAVKFQAYKAHKLACRQSPAYWDLSKEPTRSQYELFKKYEAFGAEEYGRLQRHAAELGIDFASTAFDIESLDMIDPLVPFHKIASADLTNLPLLRAVAATKKPVVMSSGGATLREVERALRELRAGGVHQIALLHCVLNYPTPPERAHLARIRQLRAFFRDVVIGYSDHVAPEAPYAAIVLAYALGARVIEKHFTHDKTLPGNDHYHAMDGADLRRLRQRLDEAKMLLGTGSEEQFLAHQDAAIKNARRSIVLNRAVRAGARLQAEDLTVKRPGTGVSPLFWDHVIGQAAARDLAEDEILAWQDIRRIEG